jgi:AcrR family transcriptional regulator
MARPRVIDRESVLDAAELVVGRDGIGRMTLDAVAAEAGISKASVIYDYGSKQHLIKAVIERGVRQEADKVHAAVAAQGDARSAEIRGYIASADQVACNASQAVALNFCSALAQDAELRGCVQAFYRDRIDAIIHDAERPTEAMIAFLAVEGLKALECFGFLSWSAEGRAAILKHIAALVDADISNGGKPPEIGTPSA